MSYDKIDKKISELPKDLSEKVKENIKKVSLGIRKNDFAATPGYMVCTYCAYNQICPFVKMR